MPNYFSTHQLNCLPHPSKPSSSCTEKNHFHSSAPVTPPQTPSNPPNPSQLPDVKLREPKAANGSGKSYWGPIDAKKDFVFCSLWSLERVASLAGLLSLQHLGNCILLLLWERRDGGGDPTEQRRLSGAWWPLPSPLLSREIAAVELQGGE